MGFLFDSPFIASLILFAEEGKIDRLVSGNHPSRRYPLAKLNLSPGAWDTTTKDMPMRTTTFGTCNEWVWICVWFPTFKWACVKSYLVGSTYKYLLFWCRSVVIACRAYTVQSDLVQTIIPHIYIYIGRNIYGPVFIWTYHHHHHHVAPPSWISLTLSRHFSLSFIASGRSSGLHPVSSHSCCM